VKIIKNYQYTKNFTLKIYTLAKRFKFDNSTTGSSILLFSFKRKKEAKKKRLTVKNKFTAIPQTVRAKKRIPKRLNLKSHKY
jgi:hypothetical protein